MSRPDLLPTLYRTEELYGWSRGMRAVNRVLLRDSLPLGAQVVELGCGGGAFLAHLARNRPDLRLLGLDRHPLAVSHTAARGHGRVAAIRADLHRLPLAPGSVDLLLLLDALDQQGVAPAPVLRACRELLAPGGRLLLRVSAYPWLTGAHDVAFNTGRRYSRAELLRLMQDAGFTSLRVTHANALLAPPVIALRLFQRGEDAQVTPQHYTADFANVVLAAALHLEARWLAHADLPAGLSLYVLAGTPAAQSAF